MSTMKKDDLIAFVTDHGLVVEGDEKVADLWEAHQHLVEHERRVQATRYFRGDK
jgi:ketosteroid isomerase-like protein